MSAVAKKFLRSKDNSFTINPKDGGTVGSLVGLGYVRRELRKTQADFYHITDKGRLWLGDRPLG